MLMYSSLNLSLYVGLTVVRSLCVRFVVSGLYNKLARMYSGPIVSPTARFLD